MQAHVPASLGLLTLLALSGCSGADLPDGDLPGVRTETAITDDFRCGELLFTQGCVLVRIDHVESGCAPEVGGYTVCNATLSWTAESGAVVPGSRLVVTAGGNGTPGCQPAPGSPCKVSGTLSHTHHFGGPGQEDPWTIVIAAELVAPGEPPLATGRFTLTLEMRVRTEPASAAAS
jgi:hypothetical protein